MTLTIILRYYSKNVNPQSSVANVILHRLSHSPRLFQRSASAFELRWRAAVAVITSSCWLSVAINRLQRSRLQWRTIHHRRTQRMRLQPSAAICLITRSNILQRYDSSRYRLSQSAINLTCQLRRSARVAIFGTASAM